MKYIAYKKQGEEFIVTFSGSHNNFNHKEMAEKLDIPKEDILGAGFFIEIRGRKFFKGESSTLDVESRGDIDRDLYIEQALR